MISSAFLFVAVLLVIGVTVNGFVPQTTGPQSRPGTIGNKKSSVSVSARKRANGIEVDSRNDEIGTRETANVESGSGMDRRRAMKATGLAILSLWLGDAFGNDNPASKWAASAAQEESSTGSSGRTIIITGCNSGVGFEGARILARKGVDKIILACRTQQKAEDTAQKILAESPTANLVPAKCDLANLSSIRKFAAGVSGSVDVVCYNAGIALNTAGEIERTVDGFEKTIGTNHLGHFYLHSLLEPKIVQSKVGGKVVITASSVHDPESPGGKQGVPATLGNLEGFSRDGVNFEMVDGKPYNGDKAYKDSKLCNILFCRELTRRLAGKNVIVNAFSPGLITSGNFFRYQNQVFSSVFNVAATNLLKVAETPEYGGAALAYMTTVETTRGEFYDSPPGTSNKYAADNNNYKGAFGNQFNVAQVSKEAQDEKKAKDLWTLSEKIVGIRT